MSFLNAIKIGRKIWLGFGVVLTLLVVICAVAYTSLTGADRNFSEYRQLARTANAAGNVQATMLSTRLAAKDFVITGSAEDARRVREREQAAIAEIEAAQALVDDPARLATLEEVHQLLDDYDAAFEQAVAHQAERDAQWEILRQVGPEIETALTEIMQGAFRDDDTAAAFEAGMVLRHALLARLYATLYVVDNGQAAYDRTAAEVAALRERADTLVGQLHNRQLRDLAETALAGVDTYATAFEAIYRAIEARNAVVSERLDMIGPEVATAVDALKASIQARQDELGPAATAAIAMAVTTALVAGAVALVIGFLAAFFIGRSISRPITGMTGAMRRLADGDKTAEIPAADHRDEVGDMAKAVKVFKDNMIRNEELTAEAAREQEARDRRTKKVEDLTRGFESDSASMLEGVAGAATELSATADGMSATAEQASRQATAVSAAAEQATGNVQTVAASAEELGTSISEIARQVQHQAEIADTASGAAHDSDQKVQELDQAAREIGAVVQLITSIAEQTNLLALNATIEAARAGDAGKGFAVVASEVKALAGQTAKATEEISQKIAAIQGATSETVTAIQAIGQHIRDMQEISSTVAAAVEEQNVATGEISENVQQAAAGTREVSVNISGVSEAAQNTGQAASDVLGASQELSHKAEQLKTYVQKFLADMRAA